MIFRRFSKSFIGIPLFIIGVVTSSCLYGQSNHTGETSGTVTIIRGVVRSVSNIPPDTATLTAYKNFEKHIHNIYHTSESLPLKQKALKSLYANRDFEYYGKPIETTFVLYLEPEKTRILQESYSLSQRVKHYISLHDGIIDSFILYYPPFEKMGRRTKRLNSELANILLFTPELFQRKHLVDHFTKAESKTADGDTVEIYTANSTPKKNPLGTTALIYSIPQNPEKPIRLELQLKTDTGNESTNIVFPQTKGNPIETTGTILVDGIFDFFVRNAKSEIKILSVDSSTTVPELSDFEKNHVKKSKILDFRISRNFKDDRLLLNPLKTPSKPVNYPYGPPKTIEELKKLDKVQNPPPRKPTFIDSINKLLK